MQKLWAFEFAHILQRGNERVQIVAVNGADFGTDAEAALVASIQARYEAPLKEIFE